MLNFKTLVMGGWMATFAFTLAIAQPEAPLKEETKENQVIAFYQDTDTRKCYKVKDSQQKICYDVEMPKVEPKVEPVPTPAEPKSAPKRENSAGAEQWRGLVAKYFPASEVDLALRVLEKESGGSPDAIGDTNTAYPSIGLFQIRLLPGRGLTQEQMMIPEENVAYAGMLYEKSGWTPWKNTMRKLGF